jgi:hypothetical protein
MQTYLVVHRIQNGVAIHYIVLLKAAAASSWGGGGEIVITNTNINEQHAIPV